MMVNGTMRVAVCCKEGLLCEAIASLLSQRGGFTVVGTSPDIRSCIAMAKDGGADVIVIHAEAIDRSDLNFLQGARTYGDFKTVLIANEVRPKALGEFEFDREFSLNGDSEELFTALREYREEGRVRGRYVREGRRRYGSFNLTKREYDVATLVARGLSNRSIAHAAGLQEQSVKNLVSVIMRKLNCENRVQVALKLTGQKPEHAEAASE